MLVALRRLLAVALVASVVVLGVGNPAAQATDTGWVQTSVYVDMPGDVPAPDNSFELNFTCSLSFRVVQFAGVNTYYISSGGKCTDGPDISPGWCQAGEMGCTEFSAQISGLECDLAAFTPTLQSSSGTVHSSFVINGYQVTDPGNCEPDEVCVTISGPTGAGLGSVSGTGCGSLPLDAPDVVEDGGECEHGNVSGALITEDYELDDDYQDGVHSTGGTPVDFYAVRAYRYGRVQIVGSMSATGWLTYVVKANGGTGVNWGSDPKPLGHFAVLPTGSQVHNAPGVLTASGAGLIGASDYELGYQSQFGSKNNWQPAAGAEPVNDPSTPYNNWNRALVVGVGAINTAEWPNWNESGSNWMVPTDATDTTHFWGRQDPGACSFYYGMKFWDMAGVTWDEPAGTVVEGDPPGEPTPDDPPEEDPDADCEGIIDGFLCAAGWLRAIWNRLGDVVHWLGNVVSAIGDMASEVAAAVAAAITSALSAILDGLAALFIPEDGFLEDVFLDIKHAWKESGPGSFISDFSDMGVTMPSSGCGGIPVAFSVSSVSVDFNIGEACSGAAASAAATVKLVVSASLVLFGGLASVRAIGSGFGWSPGIGRGPQ